MAAWPNPALPLLLVAALLAFEDWLTTPSCSGAPPEARAAGDLRAMMVADLMLLGSDASYADRYFRDHLMSKFFANSIKTMKPDMIVVLGDISAKGSELTEHKWISVIEQFEGILGRYSSLPLHIALGDKDVGTCADLDGKTVHHRAKHLPGLDSSGSGAFEISNVSFVSPNSVALLCGNNALRFGVEKVMETEKHHFQRESVNEEECYSLGCGKRKSSIDISWRHNSMKSGSGPVVLLHFPLHKSDGKVNGVSTFPDHSSVSSSSKQSGANARRLYDRLHTLPVNSTQYILQALKPRIIFNAHSGSFSDFVHADGTREVTVPAMTWKTSGVPGFVITTFDAKRGATFGCCWLALEWQALGLDARSIYWLGGQRTQLQFTGSSELYATAVLGMSSAASLEISHQTPPLATLFSPPLLASWTNEEARRKNVGGKVLHSWVLLGGLLKEFSSVAEKSKTCLNQPFISSFFIPLTLVIWSGCHNFCSTSSPM